MSSVYTLIPRPIGSFAGLDMTSRYAFGLIYDRWQLSNRPENRERFTDIKGVYCVYSRSAMAAEMGISLPTLRLAIDNLVRRGMVHTRIGELGGPIRYYVQQQPIDELEFLTNLPLDP